MSWKKILVLFLIWRIFDFLIIYFSPRIIPYLGFFPYKEVLDNFNLPSWITSLANFDGLHYILIAKNGYSQYEQAFFPLYPLLIKFLTPLFFNNSLLTGLIISNVSFLLGLFFLYKLFSHPEFISGSRNKFGMTIWWLLIFILAFPTSFFFGTVYTEGLFFLLVILSLYFLKKNKYLLVMIFTFLASLTRLVGVFLIIPIIFHYLSLRTKRSEVKQSHIEIASSSPTPRNDIKTLNIKYLISILSPLIGLGIYCFYLFKTTGDPLFFLTSQPIFGANRSSHLIFLPQVYWRYFKIFFTATLDSRYFVSVIEFLIFSFVLVILILDLIRLKNRWREEKLKINSRQNLFFELSINFFSFVNLLLPTLTGTFSSIPRYSLLSISFFIYLSKIKNNLIKVFIMIIFFVLHIILLGLFRQGYFIS